ncbi:hypothetical protein BDZ85DRAFT_279126 [Elsinoe ampelina]|uniref:histidine kinase n=1 Tax=Elsinoe ampelina TaxID=302913 RepID=A0A6A6GIH7_9PEZI|nr:hypothetical protein BDZ85DRAFT_279126 [Elsinoe ampelina]
MASRISADSSEEGLRQADLLGYLAADSRPVFVIDTPTSSTKSTAQTNRLRLVPKFANQAYLAHSSLFNSTADTNGHVGSHDSSSEWLQYIHRAQPGAVHNYQEIDWYLNVYQDRWRIFTGTPATQRFTDSHRRNEFDIARDSGCISEEHYRLLNSVDWSATAYGHPDSWSPEICDTVSMALSSPDPVVIHWGSQRSMLYNEAYPTLIGALHPAAMGRSAKLPFAAFWPFFEALVKDVEFTGQTRGHQNASTTLKRSDHGMEEASFSYLFIPIKDSEGRVLGVYNSAVEASGHIISQRRMANLLQIGEATSSATSLASFWDSVLHSFEFAGSEVPFAAVYSRGGFLASQDPNKGTPSRDEEKLICEGTIGRQHESGAWPPSIDLSETTGIALAMKRSMVSSDPSVLRTVLRTADLWKQQPSQLDETAPLAEESRALVVPLHLSSARQEAWVVFGVQDHRPFNKDYQAFISLLARQIETAASSLVMLEEERKHMESSVEEAHLEKQRLSKELAQQRREAEKSAMQFMGFAEHAPVGVYTFGPTGEILFANQAWYELLGIPYKSKGDRLWRSFIHPEDLWMVDEKWQMLAYHATNHAQFEFRVRRNPTTGSVDDDDDCGYLSSSCFAETDQDGNLKSVTGVIIDNTVHRAHEREVATRLTDALEAKRAQENFMDMVSHEMRNPLNAIIQCAEEASQLIDPAAQRTSRSPTEEELTATLDAVNTILYCGHHQKQIIDDVLTISKLDSNLLTLAPTEAQPMSVARQAVQIYNSELRASNIDVSFNQRDSFTNGNVMMDAGRVLQVLINLIGNAVKFLKGRPHRRLQINCKNSTERPPSLEVAWFPSGNRRKNSLESLPGWADHQIVYMYYSIVDTGPGMTPEESNKLFGRFKQASPRTHTQYGGSGLGLFISRELAELHGGEIGLKSAVEEGSTFAFYVQGYMPTNAESASSLEEARMNPKSPAAEIPGYKLKEIKSPVLSAISQADPVDTDGTDSDKKVTVLVVEDNKINQTVLVRQLKRAGFQTVTADNGEEALERLRKSELWKGSRDADLTPISVVLCDLEMPVMDGLTCVKHVREMQADEKLDYVPMVAVTGNARHEQVTTAKEAGFDDVVCKPYSIGKLVPLIKELANRP